MSLFSIIAIILLVLIIVPVPLVWIIGSIFPDGNMQKHAKQIRSFLAREWMRMLFIGAFIILLFLFARDYAIQVTLISAAILIGRAVALSRNK